MNVRKNLTTLIAVALTAAAIIPTATYADHHEGKADAAKAEATKAQADIVDTAVAAGNFTTLVTALKAAGLVDALKAEGPLTVFAPTDEAFAALPEGTVESLLKPENKDQLVAILKYHVVAGKVPSEAAVKLKEGKTLNGQAFPVKFDGKVLEVGGAKVVKADVWASNGVIHVIDTVLLPAKGE